MREKDSITETLSRYDTSGLPKFIIIPKDQKLVDQLWERLAIYKKRLKIYQACNISEDEQIFTKYKLTVLSLLLANKGVDVNNLKERFKDQFDGVVPHESTLNDAIGVINNYAIGGDRLLFNVKKKNKLATVASKLLHYYYQP